MADRKRQLEGSGDDDDDSSIVEPPPKRRGRKPINGKRKMTQAEKYQRRNELHGIVRRDKPGRPPKNGHTRMSTAERSASSKANKALVDPEYPAKRNQQSYECNQKAKNRQYRPKFTIPAIPEPKSTDPPGLSKKGTVILRRVLDETAKVSRRAVNDLTQVGIHLIDTEKQRLQAVFPPVSEMTDCRRNESDMHGIDMGKGHTMQSSLPPAHDMTDHSVNDNDDGSSVSTVEKESHNEEDPTPVPGANVAVDHRNSSPSPPPVLSQVQRLWTPPNPIVDGSYFYRQWLGQAGVAMGLQTVAEEDIFTVSFGWNNVELWQIVDPSSRYHRMVCEVLYHRLHGDRVMINHIIDCFRRCVDAASYLGRKRFPCHDIPNIVRLFQKAFSALTGAYLVVDYASDEEITESLKQTRQPWSHGGNHY